MVHICTILLCIHVHPAGQTSADNATAAAAATTVVIIVVLIAVVVMVIVILFLRHAKHLATANISGGTKSNGIGEQG